MNKSENYCYICFETTSNKSPCYCKSTICNKCYDTLINQYFETKCSICKYNFPINELEIKIDNLDYLENFYIQIKKIMLYIFYFFSIILLGNLYTNSYFSHDKFIFYFTLNIDVFFSGSIIFVVLFLFYISFCYSDRNSTFDIS